MDNRTAPIPKYSWLSQKQGLALVLLFVSALALPLLGGIFGWQGVTLSENRKLAPSPDFHHTALKDLPAKIDAYYDDHAGFRGAMIRASSLLLHRLAGESSRDVIIGKTPSPGQPPWYFYASEGVVEDRLGLGLLTRRQLQAWRRVLEFRAAWLQRRGIAYVFVIAPEKSSIYPELLPDSIQSHIGSTRVDQLSQYLKDTHSPVAFLDLRRSLIEAKPEGPLYFPFDTHWNGRGFFHGYQAIAQAIRPAFPDLAPGQLGADFEIRAGPQSSRADLAWMLGLSATAPAPLLVSRGHSVPRFAPATWPAGFDPSLNPNDGAYALETRGPRGRALIFHDSFFMAPLFSPDSQPLATHFERTYFAWLPPTDSSLKRFVEMEQPNLVVEEHAERVLRLIPPPPTPLDPATPRLIHLTGDPAFSIDRINTRRFKPGEFVSRNGELRIEGWAYDPLARRPAAAVEMLIDGIPQTASYGLERSAEQAGCGDCKEIGFLADYSVAGLSPGPHTLGIRVISADGTSYTEASVGRFEIR